ncbi:MAG: FAD-binding oxidoreductase [Planctomycetia bacterium]|nr:FAD-binding oxidoreductase [Planctomycetia bacterium]
MPRPDSIWFATLSSAELRELDPGNPAGLQSTPDVLVVGGGIVGLATAHYLAERGAAVQLIEAESLASGASGANAGGVWPNDQGPAHGAGFQQLAFLSRDLWARLSLRPGFEFDWRVNGFLNVNTAKLVPSAAECAARCQDAGYTVRAVDAGQIALLEPHLKPGLAAGLHYPSEAHVHPVRAALSLARAVRERGSRIASSVAAKSFVAKEGRVVSVETTAGRCAPRYVVSATGWTTDWLRGLSPSLPSLRSVSGQLTSTDPLPPLLRGAVGGDYLVIQLRSGEVVTGGNLLESESTAPDPSLSSRFADAARDLIPRLNQVEFRRAWCGRRPATLDGLPIIDRAPGFSNLFLACGHFRNGVLLAPATGKLLCDWLLADSQPVELQPFAATRFSQWSGSNLPQSKTVED